MTLLKILLSGASDACVLIIIRSHHNHRHTVHISMERCSGCAANLKLLPRQFPSEQLVRHLQMASGQNCRSDESGERGAMDGGELGPPAPMGQPTSTRARRTAVATEGRNPFPRPAPAVWPDEAPRERRQLQVSS
jgi:hypothetical protein